MVKIVERVSLLHEQETWLAEHRSEISEKISEGYAAAQRGELLDPDKVRQLLDQKKHDWLPDKHQA